MLALWGGTAQVFTRLIGGDFLGASLRCTPVVNCYPKIIALYLLWTVWTDLGPTTRHFFFWFRERATCKRNAGLAALCIRVSCFLARFTQLVRLSLRGHALTFVIVRFINWVFLDRRILLSHSLIWWLVSLLIFLRDFQSFFTDYLNFFFIFWNSFHFSFRYSWKNLEIISKYSKLKNTFR